MRGLRSERGDAREAPATLRRARACARSRRVMHARRHTKQAAGPRVESQRPKEFRHVPGCGGLHSGRPACMERAGPMHAASKRAAHFAYRALKRPREGSAPVCSCSSTSSHATSAASHTCRAAPAAPAPLSAHGRRCRACLAGGGGRRCCGRPEDEPSALPMLGPGRAAPQAQPASRWPHRRRR